jgi:hypothetical protein
VIGSILDKATGSFERRFVVNALFPAVIFWSAVVALVASVTSWNRVAGWWEEQDGARLVIFGVAAVALLVFSGAILASQTGSIARLYEGYWGTRLGRWLQQLGTGRQTKAFSRLDIQDDRDYQTRYRYYPRRKEDLLPTRLGNVLKGAEVYPGEKERYELDAVFFWPRLYAVLPDAMRETLGSARSSLDLLLLTSFLGNLFAVIAAATLGATGSSDWRLWLAEVGALAYRSAVSSATVYAELVRSAFDLYRRDLLKQMGLELPPTLPAERALWRNLGSQLYRRLAEEPEVLRFDAVPGTQAVSVERSDFLKDLADLISAVAKRRPPDGQTRQAGPDG